MLSAKQCPVRNVLHNKSNQKLKNRKTNFILFPCEINEEMRSLKDNGKNWIVKMARGKLLLIEKNRKSLKMVEYK